MATASQAHVGLSDAFARSLSLLALQARLPKLPEDADEPRTPRPKSPRPKRALKRSKRPPIGRPGRRLAAADQRSEPSQRKPQSSSGGDESHAGKDPTLRHPCLPSGYQERHADVRVVAHGGGSTVREVTVRGVGSGAAASAACEAHVREVLTLPELTCPAGASCGALRFTST